MATGSMCLRVMRARHLNIFGSVRLISQRWSALPFSSNTHTEVKDSADDTKSPNAQTDGSEPASNLMVERDLLLKEKESFVERIKELDDKYKRSLAENENLRQRMQRQIQDAKLFGIQGFCKDLLEVADVLQSATTSVPLEELDGRNPRLRSLYEGLEMTESQLQKVFNRHGLVQMDPLGHKFDPNQHEALFEQLVQGKEPGTVAVVTKIGYKLHDRTIRPALVGVVKKP